MDLQGKIMRVLGETIGMDEGELAPNTDLYDRGLLDSMATVQLIAGLSDEFGLDISPADFDREAWATPALIVADIQRRLRA